MSPVTYPMKSITSLPQSMYERALWARKVFIEQPELSQVDDEMLVWVFSEKDGLWYSILGNYSVFSPEEKRIKEAKRLEEYDNKMATAKQMAEEYYRDILYQSGIRKQVLERDAFQCQVCGKCGMSKFHIHHIEKRNEDGTDHLDNLMTVCPSCHKKADTSLYNPPWV